MLNKLRVTSSTLLPNRRRIESIEQWSHAVSDIFYPMHCSTPVSPFQGSIQSGKLDNISLAILQSPPLEHRSEQRIDKAAKDFYHIKFQLTGTASLRRYGKEAFIKPGDFILCNSNTPYHLNLFDDYSLAVITVERTYLDELLPGVCHYLGHTMDGNSPVTAMLMDFILSLTQHFNQLDSKSLQRLKATCMGLLITALKAQQRSGIIQAESVQAEHLARIKQFIDIHLTDNQLCPELIAKAGGISTRYLHMLFKSEGITVSRYIHLQRVHVCARELKYSAETNRSPTDIALDSGFNDVSHFYRCFKSVYGMTPREYRLNA